MQKKRTKKHQIDLSEIGTPDEFRAQVTELIHGNKHLFANCDLDLGQTDTVKCTMDTGDHEPNKMCPYRVLL